MNINRTTGAQKPPALKALPAPAQKEAQSEQPAQPADGFDASRAIDFSSNLSNKAGIATGVGLAAATGVALFAGSYIGDTAATLAEIAAITAVGAGATSVALQLASDDQGQLHGVGDSFGRAWDKVSAPGAGKEAMESLFKADSYAHAAGKIGTAAACGLALANLVGGVETPAGIALGVTSILGGGIGTATALGLHAFSSNE